MRRIISLILVSLLLSACGGSGGSGGSGGEKDQVSSNCMPVDGEVNYQALLSDNCKNLSDYNLFVDKSNPTDNPNGSGFYYDLSVPLFSDYTSKYRFIFLPEGGVIKYDAIEEFDFPVGTVISKTFSLPHDTAFRGYENETLLETRLLIRRSDGWVALPYIWNEDKTDAQLSIAGGFISSTLLHNGNQREFRYQVPDVSQCKQCHQKTFSESGRNELVLIGPKARHLNRDILDENGVTNQLQAWVAAGVLEGVPVDLNEIDRVPTYDDADVPLLASMDSDELLKTAKGYLDINCAHCHRREGSASNTGLHLEFNRDFAQNEHSHGVCKTPTAYRGDPGGRAYDIVPGNAEMSILHFRMNSSDRRHRMPELGRYLVHEEGVALIAAWINSLPVRVCESKP